MSRQWGMGLGQFVTSRHPCLRPKETRAPANEGLVVKPNGHMVAKVSAAACIEGVRTQGRVERVQHTKARHGLLERHTFREVLSRRPPVCERDCHQTNRQFHSRLLRKSNSWFRRVGSSTRHVCCRPGSPFRASRPLVDAHTAPSQGRPPRKPGLVTIGQKIDQL